MTTIALIRQDRITDVLVCSTPSEYAELPSFACNRERRELPDDVRVLADLEGEYRVGEATQVVTPYGYVWLRYKLDAWPIGADGHPIRTLDKAA